MRNNAHNESPVIYTETSGPVRRSQRFYQKACRSGLTGATSDEHVAPALFLSVAFAHENDLGYCETNDVWVFFVTGLWVKNVEKRTGKHTVGKRDTSCAVCCYLISRVLEWLIRLMPVGLPGTFGCFPYNVQDLETIVWDCLTI